VIFYSHFISAQLYFHCHFISFWPHISLSAHSDILSISFLPDPIFHYLPSAIFWVVQGSLLNKEILAFPNKNGKKK